MRVAFYGSTTSLDGADAELQRQHATCEAALAPWDEIAAVFFDIGSADDRSAGTQSLTGAVSDRDGGLDDLMREAANPARRFDAVIVAAPKCLAPYPDVFRRIVALMAAVGLVLCMPDPLRPVNRHPAPPVDDDAA